MRVWIRCISALLMYSSNVPIFATGSFVACASDFRATFLIPAQSNEFLVWISIISMWNAMPLLSKNWALFCRIPISFSKPNMVHDFPDPAIFWTLRKIKTELSQHIPVYPWVNTHTSRPSSRNGTISKNLSCEFPFWNIESKNKCCLRLFRTEKRARDNEIKWMQRDCTYEIGSSPSV